MFARIATFEGSEPDQVQAAVDAISAAGGPPPGVEAHALTVFRDPGTGRVIVVGRFATREALDSGHATLSAMAPPAGGFGRQVSVDLTEVVMEVDAQTMRPAG